jgi:hypothetical protein
MQITLETFRNAIPWVTTVEHILSLYRKQKSICKIEHEATTSKIGEDQVFYCNQRGIRRQSL